MTRRTFHTLALSSAATSLLPAAAPSSSGNTKSKIKIGQIGTKHGHAAGQLETLRQCSDFEVVGIVEPDPQQQQAVKNQPAYAGLPWLTEEQLLNTPGLQAVCIETDVANLLTHAERAASAGLHLHIDKPAGSDLAKFKSLLDTCTANQRLVKLGYMFRYNPAFELMLQAIREGWLGEVFSIHTEMSKQLSPTERNLMLPYPGGSMFELGCHLIDSVVHILGAPEKVTPFIRKNPTDGFAENMLAVLDYPKATVSVRSAMIEVQGGARRQFTVCGDQGSFEIFPLEHPVARLMLDQPRGPYKKGVNALTFEKTPRYAADWTDFAKAIRGETAWEFTPDHDYTVQKTVLQASGLM
ncbi:Gfo/Idh/MocA family oxidoreductase [Phragmitibacter flavus]|uniref:Gfo/Idh/MocA family oxidoreductase n=1 Tax=Phragmitibacter flavus TaxID=2576071 RepID=A0A5R8K7Z2_9BACT|nr:Gfo/Idh/MocA family oxidoreductase [Phragmitibacter flavus]TLD68446.1 Gfo/Idh/MocA family oxidoreductase [Phragmitibacter flavus]